jgi:hypothetical protein
MRPGAAQVLQDDDEPQLVLGITGDRRLPPHAPAAYAATPGTGPEGETCRTCAHRELQSGVGGRYWKCGLANYTRGPATDIRLRTPACVLWVRR